ncbi:hypothetical protein [Microbacterium elymi]|uniref:Uncharacterized protein n=1 Tax=Microbacterium elymi TaxID=2909587 RepID=A0ABY5NKV8_9MICO|nr:hypothetical protein [Microbacterium elymi]UUT35761.1 hypothetical protein L2X98_21340 [Microbacterium elymi]
MAALCLFIDGPPPPPPAAESGDDEEIGMMTTGRRGPNTLPLWVCGLALLVALVIPNTVPFALDPASRTSSFGTWYVGAIGLLMTIIMVRRRPWMSWIGLLALGVSTIAWLGVGPALTAGLVGSVMWVVAAQLACCRWTVPRATRHAWPSCERAASAWRAAQLGRQRERRIQVQRALAVAGPILSRAIEKGGDLDERERAEARISEGSCATSCAGRGCSTTACGPSWMPPVVAAPRSRSSTKAGSTGSPSPIWRRSAPIWPPLCARPSRTGCTSVPRRIRGSR